MYTKIINLTRKRTITSYAKVADSFVDSSLGLLISTNPRYMIFHTRFGIHTFFMKTPIDVLILDCQHKVRVVQKNLLPNRIFMFNPHFTTVLEMPSGTVDQNETRINDKIFIG